MTTIRQADLIESVASALQYISYYHPVDYITHLARAYEREQSAPAKDAIAQILTNSRMCAEGRRPICQDTGIVNAFLKIGMDVKWEGFSGSIADAVNAGVRQGRIFGSFEGSPAPRPSGEVPDGAEVDKGVGMKVSGYAEPKRHPAQSVGPPLARRRRARR